MHLRGLAHIIHDGSSRNHESRGETGVESQGPEAYLKQYVEGLRGEPARSSESTIAVEAVMNNVGSASLSVVGS